MTEKQHIKRAFDLMSEIAVRGLDVDRLAMARAELRAAFRLLDQREKEVSKDNG